MSAPIVPNDFAETIPSPGGSFCEKMIRSFRLPFLIYTAYKFFVGDDGKLTADGAAFICQLNCSGSGTGPGPGGFGAPTISASDGGFSDRVRVTWSSVAAATAYDVYRNFSDNNSTATLIGTTAGTSYDDTNVVLGTTYYYWVKAKDGTNVSAFSNSDSGFVSAPIAAVTDLDATKGFYSGIGASKVALVWTPSPGAERYDIYRFTEDNFTSAQAAGPIDTNRVPYDNSASLVLGPTPYFVDNGGELVYYDEPPNKFLTYYYWVVAKNGSGTTLSGPSNSVAGWAVGDGSGALPISSAAIESGISDTIPAGAVRAWVVLLGSGAGGAAGGAVYGGGGGGSGPVLFGKYSVSPSGVAKLRVVSTPEANGTRAAATQNGGNSAATVLQYSADGTFGTSATLLSAAAATGGLYSASGGGTGGAGSTGTTGTGVTATGIKPGRAGGNAMGAKGGRSGYHFGGTRKPPGHFLPGSPGSHEGDGTTGQPAASGSYANPNLGSLVEGGAGHRGYATIIYYSS